MNLLLFCFLCLILGEHVLWTVDIFNKVVVVNLLTISAVTVFPNDQIKYLIVWWHQIECFQHAQELLLSDVQLLRAVEIFEGWFEKNSLRHNCFVEPCHGIDHALFLLIREHLFKFKLNQNFVTYSLGPGGIDSCFWVTFIAKYSVGIVYKISVADKLGSILELVFVDQILGILLRQANVKCSKTSPELNEAKGVIFRTFYLQQPRQQLLS